PCRRRRGPGAFLGLDRKASFRSSSPVRTTPSVVHLFKRGDAPKGCGFRSLGEEKDDLERGGEQERRQESCRATRIYLRGFPSATKECVPMIVRIWHGYTKPENADAYADLLRTKVLP